MNPKTEHDYMLLCLQSVVDYKTRIAQPPQPMTEHEGLMPTGQSTLHPFHREPDGGALDVSRHLGEDVR